jgi:hypothetical protein
MRPFWINVKGREITHEGRRRKSKKPIGERGHPIVATGFFGIRGTDREAGRHF